MHAAFFRRQFWLSAIAALAFGAFTIPAYAGPFSGLEGTWAGGGRILLDNGTHERIRCRASYAVGSDGNFPATVAAMRKRQLCF